MKKMLAATFALGVAISLAGCASEPTVMPDLVGMTYNEAKDVLEDLPIWDDEFEVIDASGEDRSIYVAGANGDEWIVSAQSISAGNEVDKYSDGFSLALTVSNPEMEEREAEREAEQQAKEAARQEEAAATKAEEDENIAKWGEDYLKADAAIAAMEMYGKEMYPYGFKLHTVMGKLAEEHEEDGSWFFKFTCDVTNEYGETLKDLNCEAQIAGTDSNPVVTYFEVY